MYEIYFYTNLFTLNNILCKYLGYLDWMIGWLFISRITDTDESLYVIAETDLGYIYSPKVRKVPRNMQMTLHHMYSDKF